LKNLVITVKHRSGTFSPYALLQGAMTMQNESLPVTATLAIPISVENPVGKNPRENLSEQSLYQQIKALRAKSREQERYAVESDNNPELLSDWKLISELSATLLHQEAKDLEVTAWLIEGLTRVHGFAGLSRGFEIATALIEAFWPDLYPLADEDGVQTTLAPLTGLNGERNNGTLITPINCIPLLTHHDIQLASWQYSQSDSLPLFQEAAIAAGWKKIKSLTEDIQYCSDAYEKLCLLLDEKCGKVLSPPTSNIRNVLKTAEDIAKALQQFAPPPPDEIENNSETERENTMIKNTLYTDRQKTFQELQKIANYFRHHEPNSPVPFLLEQAIRWGNMSLPELLSELVEDENMLAYSYKLIGAKPVANQ
jgi:type VI secretion system protein ImpA